MRYSFSDHEGKVICIHGELTDQYRFDTYRMIKNVSLAAPTFKEGLAGPIINKDSIVLNAADHLWLSPSVISSGLYSCPLYDQKFYLGRVTRYRRSNNTIDFGLEPISRKEYLVNVLRIFISPLSNVLKYTENLLHYINVIKHLDREAKRIRDEDQILEATFYALKDGDKIFLELKSYYEGQKMQLEDLRLTTELSHASEEFNDACQRFFKWNDSVKHFVGIYEKKLEARKKKKKALLKIKQRNKGGFGK